MTSLLSKRGSVLRMWVAYVMRSLRSLGFFRPPNAIFVPGMYFFGFSRYSNCWLSANDFLAIYIVPIAFVPRCLHSKLCPLPCWHLCRRTLPPVRSFDRTDRAGSGQSCSLHLPRGCDIESILSVACVSTACVCYKSKGAVECARTLNRVAPFLLSPDSGQCH